MRVFQKGFLAKYGLLLFLILATPMALGGVFVPPFLPGILITIVVFFLWRSALQAVYLVQVDKGRLLIRSFIHSREITAPQIMSIDPVTVYNRRGVAKSSIRIELKDESTFKVSGFPEGTEILYGFLKNWWSSYQSS